MNIAVLAIACREIFLIVVKKEKKELPELYRALGHN